MTDIQRLRRETADALEAVELSDLEERLRQAKADRKVDLEHQERVLAATETVALNTSPRVVRSTMRLKDKSEFISANGGQAYLDLPWT